MLNLHLAFEDFTPEIDLAEPSIDRDFITEFLRPYFRNLPREELAAKVEEIIAFEQDRLTTDVPRRRAVINTGPAL